MSEQNKSLVLIVNETLQNIKLNRLTVLCEIKRGASRYFKCICECGTTKEIYKFDVLSGKTRSCGCLSRQMTTARNTRHGMIEKFPKEYWIWKGINQRCHNPRSKSYLNYGARGIFVSKDWRDSFESFMRDMGNRPSTSHSVERINNDGPYSKENCLWADRLQQAANRRNTNKINFDGEFLTFREIGVKTGIKPTILRHHVKKNGLSISEAIKRSNCGR